MKKSTKKIENKKTETYSQSDLKRYLGSLSEETNEHLKAINENFQFVNAKLDSHTEMVGDLSENIEIIKEDISIMKSDLKQKVDYTEFASLVKRVGKLESKLN